MLTKETIIKKLNESNLTHTSMNTRINYQQLWRLARGKNAYEPRAELLEKLSNYFEGR